MTTQIVASKLNGDIGLAMVETVALAVVGFAGLYLLRRTEARSVVGTVRGVAPPARRSPAGASSSPPRGWALAALLLLPHASLILLSFVPRNTWTTEPLPPVLDSRQLREPLPPSPSICGRSSTRSGWPSPRPPRPSLLGFSRPRRGARPPQRPFRARERPRVAHRGALGPARNRLRRGARGGLLGSPAGRRRASCSSGPRRSCRSAISCGAFRSPAAPRSPDFASSIRRSKKPRRLSARAPGGASRGSSFPHLKPALLAGASLAFLVVARRLRRLDRALHVFEPGPSRSRSSRPCASRRSASRRPTACF